MWLEVSGGEAGLLPARAGAGGMQQQTAWRDCGGARTSNWSRLQVPLKRCSSSCCSEASFLLAWELYDLCKCFTGSLSLRESVNSALKEGRESCRLGGIRALACILLARRRCVARMPCQLRLLSTWLSNSFTITKQAWFWASLWLPTDFE